MMRHCETSEGMEPSVAATGNALTHQQKRSQFRKVAGLLGIDFYHNRQKLMRWRAKAFAPNQVQQCKQLDTQFGSRT